MKFYVDGSCRNNGSAHSFGGFGVVGVDENDNICFAYSKQNTNTTNNREEIRAILYVLINYGFENPIVYSDSAYCVNTFSSWMYNWKNNNWLKSDGNPPENLDLIKAYYDLESGGRHLQLIKIKGHNGIYGNELADKLATGVLRPEEVI